MDLTSDLEQEINKMNIVELLRKWRFAPIGDPLLQGESGAHLGARLSELCSKDPDAYVRASKALGWG